MNVLVEVYKTLAKHCEENGHTEVLVTASFVVLAIGLVGLGIGWYIGRRSAVANLQKTSAETSKTKTDEKLQWTQLMDRADKRRAILRENERDMTTLLKDVITTVQDGKKRILRTLRNDICELNSNVYMPALNNCLDDCEHFLPTKKMRSQRVVGDILPALALQLKLFTALNHQHFLDHVRHAKKYQLDDVTREQLFAAIRRCVPWWHFKNRSKIRQLETQFKEYSKRIGT